MGALLICLIVATVSAIPVIAQTASGTTATREVAAAVGNDACKLCHAKVCDSFASTPHSKLLTAAGIPDGSKGCEGCHGPGSLHAASTGKKKLAIPDSANLKAFDSVCVSCHAASSNAAPQDWQKLDSKLWGRSEHSSQGVACLSCHTAHSSDPNLLNQQPVDLCTKCHGDLIKGSYTHTPVKQKQCLTCHNPHGTSRSQMVNSGIQATCVSCHPAGADLNKKHFDYNVGTSDCTDCHDPHSHDNSGALLKSKQHTPFKSKNCATCHKPAGTNGEAALVKPEKELCVTCHSSGLPNSAGAHRPVADGMCTSCHSPHASNAKSAYLRESKVSDVCFKCHSNVQTAVDTAKYPHKAMDGLNCLQCHKAHSSTEDNLLKKPSIDLCKGCHESHMHPFGKKPDGSEVIDPTTKKMLVCASCHEPHGSQFEHLTKGDYERDLCLRCHKEGMH